MICGWEFEKYLTQRIDKQIWDYDFNSDNGRYQLFITVGMYGWWHKSWIMPDD